MSSLLYFYIKLMDDINDLVLCMVKRIGDTTYRFFFQHSDTAPDFYGDNFEQKPASICNDLIPDENSYCATYTAEATDGSEYETSEFSNLFSMQDGLDDCIALMFNRDYDRESANNDRLVLHFGDGILDVADKLFKYGFDLDGEFPQREPTDFLTGRLQEIQNTDSQELILCRLKMHDKMRIREDLTSYTYDLFFIKRERLEEFRNYDEWFDRRESQLYTPDFSGFEFDAVRQMMCDNIVLDSIWDQNDYSVVECIDGCVCLAYENIDGKEYPDGRIVLNVGDSVQDVEAKIQGRAHLI